MNTSVQSPGELPHELPYYVSCITCDGYSILPPLMTDAKRTEMRQYRELAMDVEQRLQAKTSSASQQTEAETVTDSKVSPSPGKHERKLSYTLLEPSAALLAACANIPVVDPGPEPEEIEIDIEGDERSDSSEEETSSTSHSILVTPKKVEGGRKYFEDSESHPSSKKCDAEVSLPGKHVRKLCYPSSDPGVGVEPISTQDELDANDNPANNSFPAMTFPKDTENPQEVDKLPTVSSIPTTPPRTETLKTYFDDDLIEIPQESDSDKENRSESSPGKRVRNLSYTLSEPSVVLSAAAGVAVEDKGNESVQESDALSTVPPSLSVTPLKLTQGVKKYFEDVSTPTNQELDNRLDALNRHLAQLQVGLGVNKKVHLERYLGEVALAKEMKDNNEENENEIDYRFRQLKDTHEKQMAALVEMHNTQQLQLKQDFELQRTLLQKKMEDLSNDKSIKFDGFVPETGLQQLSGSVPTTSNPAESATTEEDNVDEEGDKSISARRTLFDSRPSTTAGSSARTFISSSATITSSRFGQTESLKNVRLSKLQMRMQSMSPNVFKIPPDARSPLLKGLTFPDPLDRPRLLLRIPAKAQDPAMKPKFNRVTASVRGYLTRRLLQTEKLQGIIQTIRDTVDLLLKLYEETPSGQRDTKIKTQDLDLHRRSLQQLTGACASFHDVFFKLSITERMAIIATDREKQRNKALKNELTHNSPAKRNISAATLKAMERRLSLTSVPHVSKAVRGNKPGSRSGRSETQRPDVKLSPKRRRMSHFVQPAPVSHSKNNRSRGTTKWRGGEQLRSSNPNATFTRSTGPNTIREGYGIETNFTGAGMSSSDFVFSQNTSRPTTADSNSNYSTLSNNSRFSIGHSEKSQSGRKSVAHRTPWNNQ